MTARMVVDDLTTDAVFPLEGQALPREHAQALQQALCAILPWLDSDPVAGIHPVKLVPGSAMPALLSRRARLLLRVASRRMDELVALAGLELKVAGQHPAPGGAAPARPAAPQHSVRLQGGCGQCR
jgi:hypothetical protein